MSVCLDYQSVYYRKSAGLCSLRRLQAFALALLFVGLVCKVWIKIQTVQLGYQLAEQRKQTVEYDMQRRELNLQLSVLTRPDTLTRMASERLQMKPLVPAQVRRLAY